MCRRRTRAKQRFLELGSLFFEELEATWPSLKACFVLMKPVAVPKDRCGRPPRHLWLLWGIQSIRSRDEKGGAYNECLLSLRESDKAKLLYISPIDLWETPMATGTCSFVSKRLKLEGREGGGGFERRRYLSRNQNLAVAASCFSVPDGEMNDLQRLGTSAGWDLRHWPEAHGRASSGRVNLLQPPQSKGRFQHTIYGPLEKRCARLKLQCPDVQTSWEFQPVWVGRCVFYWTQMLWLSRVVIPRRRVEAPSRRSPFFRAWYLHLAW